MSVLRLKPGNPPPPWFWGLTKKPTVDFEAKLGETIATSFDAKLEKIIDVGTLKTGYPRIQALS
jgi:hypothetical protein